MRIRFLLLVALHLVVSVTVAANGPFTLEFAEITNGVWAGVRLDGPRFPVMGNTTFVVGDDGVVVFDGGGMPAMSDLVIAKIRSVTDKPVTHVVISHWHGDHFFGIFRFAEEYPGVQIVAHEFTRDVINSSRINYVDRQTGFVADNIEEFRKIVATGEDSEGTKHSQVDRDVYQRIIDDRDDIDREFLRARVIPPNIVFADNYEIDLGNRVVQLKYLGYGNTAGDIVMWLPEERVVATGDIVVLPSPYAFNVPPRRWADTLRAVNALEYETLVPGHGALQKDSAYVDLIIEAAESIADQRDALLAEGINPEAVAEALDFSAFENRFTHGDEYIASHYNQWFVGPFRQAAMKALTGEPMVQVPAPVSVSFDDERWNISAAEHEVVDYLGKRALQIKGGGALLPELSIVNGIIEFDLALTETRGFAGLVFRYQDDENYENFYVRPHQSNNPDANQYQPVFNGVAAWQLYHGHGYAAPVKYRYDAWIPVKMVFAGNQADVYIDSDEPVLHISDLKRDIAGGAIGVNSADFSAVHFANFRYTELANSYIFPPVKAARISHDIVASWQVSDAFAAESVFDLSVLDESHLSDRTWQTMDAEASGIVNLAKVQGIRGGNNTVFAMLNLESEIAQTKSLAFGYSDIAAVYLNNKLIYRGDNTYRSRDYRYLGTMGLFDSVALPLLAGSNELCIAVTEAFGGWGLMGQINTLDDAT